MNGQLGIAALLTCGKREVRTPKAVPGTSHFHAIDHLILHSFTFTMHHTSFTYLRMVGLKVILSDTSVNL